jgi:hypothetical protein
MIRKKACPALDAGVQRFSEKDHDAKQDEAV